MNLARLDKYRDKRNFRSTPEPSGRIVRRPSREGGLFVIHKHAARRLHYDLRLEHDGVLESWAVPKGPSRKPGEKRLAVHVEDHPLEYGEFEGVIPKNEYGGGTVMLWDRGHWRQTRRSDGRIDFELEGHKLRGAWTLTRMRGRSDDKGADNWLLIKRRDPEALSAAAPDPDVAEDRSVATGRTMDEIAQERVAKHATGRGAKSSADTAKSSAKTAKSSAKTAKSSAKTPKSSAKTAGPSAKAKTSPNVPKTRTRSAGSRKRAAAHADPPDLAAVKGARRADLPDRPRPQLATLADAVPEGDGWIHEIKFDGYRIMAAVQDGNVRLISRNGKDWTGRFPEIAGRLEKLPAAALLDGEVVALQPDGTSSFRGLQEALSDARTGELVYQVFDLVYLDGYDLAAAALLDRKALLNDLMERAGFVGSARVRFTDHLSGAGGEFYARACHLALEGIISKRASARYRSARSRQWLKIKCSRQEELLIAGFTDPGGARTGFGALLLGAWGRDGRLIYAGKVGTGFDQRQLASLSRELKKLEIDACPFAEPPQRRGVHWVTPELVAEVEFTEWTRDGSLRHPSFRGLREDKDPKDIRMPDLDEPAGPPTPRSTGAAEARGSASPSAARPKARAAGPVRVAGVTLTNPDRVLYPDQGITKLALAQFYEEIEAWILPLLRRRPLALVRCPQGRTRQCFFQKHPGAAMPADMPRTGIREKEGKADYLYVEDLHDLIGLVQAGTLELHVWGSRVDDHEKPDMLVFDLDPGPRVDWSVVLDVARSLRDRLDALGLAGFVRTTGGKGLHVVTPLEPKLGWDDVKAFARAVADAHARDDRERLTINMAKAQREGRIFLDYLRNGRGATAIASYSTRAREGAPVAVPVRWDELNRAMAGNRYNVGNLRRRLNALKHDPWAAFDEARRPLTRQMLKAVGAAGGRKRR